MFHIFTQPLQDLLGRTITINGRQIKISLEFEETDFDWNGTGSKRCLGINLEDGVRTFDRFLFKSLYKLGNPPYFTDEHEIDLPFTAEQFDNFKLILKMDVRGLQNSVCYAYSAADYLVVSNYMMPFIPIMPYYCDRVFERLYSIYGDEIPVSWDVLKPLIYDEINCIGWGYHFCDNRLYSSQLFTQALVEKYPSILENDHRKRLLEDGKIHDLLLEIGHSSD